MKFFPGHPNELLEVIDSDDSPCIIDSVLTIYTCFWQNSERGKISGKVVSLCARILDKNGRLSGGKFDILCTLDIKLFLNIALSSAC